MQLVAQVGLESLQCCGQARLLARQFLFRNDAIGECVGERFELLDSLLNHRVFGVVVEPACTCHESLLRVASLSV
jgi:hypothetical protein